MYIGLYIIYTPSLRTSRGTDEPAAENPQFGNSSMKIYDFYIFRMLILYIYFLYFRKKLRLVFICLLKLARKYIRQRLTMFEQVPNERPGIKAMLNNPR